MRQRPETVRFVDTVRFFDRDSRPARSRVQRVATALLLLVASLVTTTVQAEEFQVPATAGTADRWSLRDGQWTFDNGVLEQTDTKPLTVALFNGPAFQDFVFKSEFNIKSKGSGVRAAAFVFRATGTRTYYWLHLDSRHGNAIMTRSTPENEWIELIRKPVQLSWDKWHQLQISCQQSAIQVKINGQPVLELQDQTSLSGRVGVGTSEGHVAFRNLMIDGTPLVDAPPLTRDQISYQRISQGGSSGPYQAFPDACRLPNGQLMCVFYDGYGHISLPNQEWPRGGRIGMVLSADEGATWSAPQLLFDGPEDDRDPHIAVMKDGTLYCSYFAYRKIDGKPSYDTCLISSKDGGQTWDSEPLVLARNWAVSAPVRELKDGTRLLGIYAEENSTAFGGILRSTDAGKTWSQPIAIDPMAAVRLDAETDVIQLQDGSVFAALRGDRVNMHYSISRDAGLTWSPVKDIGFAGHCPHLTRLKNGQLLLTHRLPKTALHVSHDEGQTWQGPYQIDDVIGAYPATVELNNGAVLVVYYEEGSGSAIRASRFRLTENGIQKLAWELHD